MESAIDQVLIDVWNSDSNVKRIFLQSDLNGIGNRSSVVVNFCEAKGYTLILCGKKGAWHNSKNDEQDKEIATYYVSQMHLDDLRDCDDEIFKVAVFNQNGYTGAQYEALSDEFAGSCTAALSGSKWVDIMNAGVSKGAALSKICNRFGVGYNEVMAFGDYLNDVDMLDCAYYSFAMSNAHKSVKNAANFSEDSLEIRQYSLDVFPNFFYGLINFFVK